jgi:predicted phage replisome organizer
MSEKKYFWFKMEDNFFQKKEIKKLRSIAGGDTFVIIYLKIILLSLKTGGKLYFEGIDDDFASEIALEIDEDKNNVYITLEYLLRHSAVLQIETDEYHVNVSNLIGSETSTAIRVRKHREKKKRGDLSICYNETPKKQIDNGEIE